MPPAKNARYANNYEGSSSGGSCCCLLPPIDDSIMEEEEGEEAPRGIFNRGDYVLKDEEKATMIQQVAIISEAEARAWFRREEEEEAVR
ncbi:hypothetical protein QYE76_033746 [Lolium multiflorum]|uniref:Uncharacterized protein n=1 Tax=Lolium multiflorum TaxID=4521 RepID=A0AAD8QW19_LOLMU|nr:hypothetical protein QYE76_033746 [Lolium multiflorum]